MAKMIWRPPNPENANDGQAVVGDQANVATESAGRDDKLEILSDGAWFAAVLSLREDGTTNVHFDGFSVDEDEHWDAEKIKSLNPINEHIRVVSEQLQDEECDIVKVNKVVCALKRAQDKDGWHDAVVIEMRKRLHTFGDEGETCTCSFTVTWRDGPAKGLTERNLTCAEICLLSTKNVETHPLVVDILRHASGDGRGMDHEKEGPSSSGRRVRRSKGDTDDDTDSSQEQVYTRRLKRLKPTNTDVEAKDPLDQSELVVDDRHAGTASAHRECRDVPSLSSGSAELTRDNSLASRSAELIREITAEICAGVNHLKQSNQAVEATQDTPTLSSLAAADTDKRIKGRSVDHLKQSKQAVKTTQDVLSRCSPAAADSSAPMKTMSVELLKQSKQAVETTQDVLSRCSPAAADSSAPMKTMSVELLKQSKQAVETTQDVLSRCSPAAADSSAPMKTMSVELLKQSRQVVETTQDVLSRCSPAAADSSAPMKTMSVELLKQSKQAVESTQDVPPLSSPAGGGSNRPKKKMRGQAESEESFPSDLSEQRERIFGTKSSERVCKEEEQQQKVSTDAKSLDRVGDSRIQQKPTLSPNAKPVEDRRLKTKVFIDLTEEEECELPLKKETVKAKADPLEEHHLSRPSQVQAKEEDVKAKANFLEERHLGRRPSEVQVKEEDVKDESGGKDGFSKLPSDLDIKEWEAKADPMLKQERAGSLAATVENKVRSEAYKTQKKIQILAAKSDGLRSKKVRITVEFDMELDESASIVEGLSLSRSFPTGAKVTSYSHNYEEELLDSGGKSEAVTTTCKPAEPKPEAPPSGPTDCTPSERNDAKLFHVSVTREKGCDNGREELPQSVDERFGEPKKKDPSVQPKVEHDLKFAMHSSSAARSGNEQELVDAKSRTGLGSALDNVICLSDEEEDGGVIAGSSMPPTSSTRELSNSDNLSGSDRASADDQQEGWNVHLRNNQARNRRSAFTKNVLGRSGCNLMIDNLEVGVRESDLREQLLKFCNEEKIQSVTIPPPHPEFNSSTGYVIFSDKETADTVAGVLARCIIVSVRGRPWVVRTQGQEEPDLLRKSDLMGDVLDGNALSSENFKVVTRRQLSEYNAARKRQRVFSEHRKQTRVMFQRHAQEEKKMDANPERVLYR